MKSSFQILVCLCLPLCFISCQSQPKRTSQYVSTISSKEEMEAGKLRFPLDALQRPGYFLDITTKPLTKTKGGYTDDIEVQIDVLFEGHRFQLQKFSGAYISFCVNPPLQVDYINGNASLLRISGGDGAGVWSQPVNAKHVLDACDYPLKKNLPNSKKSDATVD